MMQHADEREVEPLEVEVERLPAHDEEAPPEDFYERVALALGPVLPGMILDGIDLITFTPVVGVLIGFPAGIALSRQIGLSWKKSFWFGLAAAAYCGTPFTTPIPIATLIGVVARFMGPKRSA